MVKRSAAGLYTIIAIKLGKSLLLSLPKTPVRPGEET
jgi:hypothetical protein